MLECATTENRQLWAALEQVASQPCIPRGEEGLGVECILDLPGIDSLQGRSYQRFLIAQPVKLGGLGLRSLEETRYPAFLGGLEQALPRMVAGELCPVPLAPGLRGVIGCMAGQQRWAEMLAGGSRTAEEFRAAWNCLSGEAINVWNFLGLVSFTSFITVPKFCTACFIVSRKHFLLTGHLGHFYTLTKGWVWGILHCNACKNLALDNRLCSRPFVSVGNLVITKAKGS